MSVKIRLRRMGANDEPFFRVVATDSRYATTGRFLETLGWYDPKKDGVNFELKSDRIDYWLAQGAKPSDTVNSLIKKMAKTAASAPAAPAPEPAKEAEPVVKEEQPAAEEAAPAAETADEKAPEVETDEKKDATDAS